METTLNLDKNTIRGVQDLIEINIDSSKGFAEAADKIENSDIATFFRRCGERRDVFARELQRAVATSGEEPKTSGSLAGTLHRWWLDLRGTVQDGDEHGVLSEAERGEDAIKGRYESVLKSTTGSPLNATLQEQYVSVKNDHDMIRDMRDARA
ncbi:MAG: histidine kinase [Phycisphaerae bacterium]|nr:histidine kinase [Phycisphaerae bacterium]